MAVLIVYLAVRVVHPPVQEVEDVAGNDRGKRHGAPVLTQTVHSKTVRDQARIHAEEDAIAETCKPRNEDQQVWILYCGSCNLGEAENDGGHKETPEAGAAQSGNQYVAPNS